MVNVPLLGFLKHFDVGYECGKYLERRSSHLARWYFGSMTVLLLTTVVGLMVAIQSEVGSLSSFLVPVQWIQEILPFASNVSKGVVVLQILISFLIATPLYLVLLSFPLSPLFWLLDRRVRDSRPELKQAPLKKFFLNRQKAPKDAYFAGINAVSGKPLFISDEHRMEHTQIVGVTGGGKTEGGIVPALIHDIAWGRGAIIIDM